VQFRLTYRGELRGRGSARPQHINALRLHFHRQLKRLWDVPPLNAKVYRRWLERQRIEDEYGVLERRGDHRFVSIVSAGNDLLCSLHVTFLRPSSPGDLVHGGDLDNRLKTLLDALRIPDVSLVPAGWTPSDEETPLHCLMSDDNLLTGIAIESDRLLEPPTPDIKAELEVYIVIHVKLTASRVTMGNVSLVG
jgi:hypothetical protein